MKPIVAIVGRPNVGKSTLFNRLIRRRRSIVADEPGVTRDRIYADATIEGRKVVLVDTGGFDPQSKDAIMQRVLDQTQLAIDEADVVVFVVDVRAGLLPEDTEIAGVLRRANKRVIVAANKVDDTKHEPAAAEFHRLGVQDVLPVSAEHGVHFGDLAETVAAALPPPSEDEEPEAVEEEVEACDDEEVPPEEEAPSAPIRVAVIGRPNVGKSSLVNRLLGEDRHLVSEIAGTTRDSIDSLIARDGKEYLFIDTAGLRRKRSIAHRVEKFSVFATLKGIERSDVALLLIDATQPIAEQDARVSGFAYERGRAVLLVVSKWDAKEDEVRRSELVEKVRAELPHLAYAPIVFTSAKTGYGLDRLLPAIDEVHAQYGKRVTTGELNRFVEQVMQHHPPQAKRGRQGKIYYVRQIGVRPPRFLVSVNDPDLIHFSYRRYFVNEIRKRYGFQGVPLLVGYRGRAKRKKG